MGRKGCSFRKKALIRFESEVLLYQSLVKGIERAAGVGREGGDGVNEGFLVSILPLEPPCVTVSLK